MTDNGRQVMAKAHIAFDKVSWKSMKNSWICILPPPPKVLFTCSDSSLYLSHLYPNEDSWNQLNNWKISSPSFKFLQNFMIITRQKYDDWIRLVISFHINCFFLYFFYLKHKFIQK
jgi:hypothetical protein